MSRRVPSRCLGLFAAAVLATLPGLAAAEPAHVVILIDRIDLAYHASDSAGLEAARRGLLKVASAAPDDSRAGFYAAYARFRQALGATTDKGAAKAFLDDCITELTNWVAWYPRDAEAHALLGSCYGMSTKYYPLGLMARGMEARKQLGTARELAPGSPWVLLQDGLLDDAAPRMFGGSTRAGIRKLERAAQLFATEQAAGSSAAGWALLETWQQLARMYAVVGQGQAATAAAERADVLKQQRTAPTLRRVAATLETTATS